jgi:hypothetical protein
MTAITGQTTVEETVVWPVFYLVNMAQTSAVEI